MAVVAEVAVADVIAVEVILAVAVAVAGGRGNGSGSTGCGSGRAPARHETLATHCSVCVQGHRKSQAKYPPTKMVTFGP